MSVVLVVGAGRVPADLERALLALDQQEWRPDEVIVVLNGARRDVVPETALTLRTVELAGDLGCSPGRNAGAATATTDIVVFSDDDGELIPRSIRAVTECFVHASPTVGAIAGFVSSCLDRDDRVETTGMQPILRFSGGACAVRRHVFELVGGWREARGRGLGHEFDLAVRLWRRGYDVITLPDFVLKHPPRHREHFAELAVDNNSELLRTYFEHFPLPYAMAAAALKLVRDGTQLIKRGELSTVGGMVGACAIGARGGWRAREPLSWRQLAELRRIDGGAPSTRLGT
ncbi:MAG: glycosyltransferase [Gaiellaceae bacterium MAG52_C11]|nr:glycosyltransferase [Candidatus Gaiellasilicea maunaloa]